MNTKRSTRKETTHSESTLVETVEEEYSAPGCDAVQLPHREHSSRATSWHHLQVFEIEYPPTAGSGVVPQVKVFANGRQQIRVRVLLSPRDANGAYVAVPVDELRGMLTLVDYNTGYALPVGWNVQTTKNEFGYDASVISSAPGKSETDYSPHDNRAFPGVLANDTVSVDLYVTTDRPNSAIRVAASITPPGALDAVQTRPGAAGNQFDSSVNIDARPPLDSPLSDFALRTMSVSNDHFACTNHYFTLNVLGRPIKLLRVSPYESEHAYNIFVDSGDSNGWEGVFTICSNGNSSGGGQFHYFDVPTYLDRQRLYPIMAQIEQFESGAILYVQHLFRNNKHFYWDGGEASDVPNRRVYFVDEYGNFHRVRVGSASSSDFPWFGVYGKW